MYVKSYCILAKCIENIYKHRVIIKIYVDISLSGKLNFIFTYPYAKIEYTNSFFECILFQNKHKTKLVNLDFFSYKDKVMLFHIVVTYDVDCDELRRNIKIECEFLHIDIEPFVIIDYY